MGVNCEIWLPPTARIGDVADVIGILAGAVPKKKEFSSGGGWYAYVPGVKAEPSNLASCSHIAFQNGDETWGVLWHWEPTGGTGERLLMPSATAFWRAMGSRLIQFFGGRMTYHDCDDHGMDEQYTVDYDTCPTDGEPWREFQQRKMDIKPLTKEEIERYW